MPDGKLPAWERVPDVEVVDWGFSWSPYSRHGDDNDDAELQQLWGRYAPMYRDEIRFYGQDRIKFKRMRRMFIDWLVAGAQNSAEREASLAACLDLQAEYMRSKETLDDRLLMAERSIRNDHQAKRAAFTEHALSLIGHPGADKAR